MKTLTIALIAIIVSGCASLDRDTRIANDFYWDYKAARKNYRDGFFDHNWNNRTYDKDRKASMDPNSEFSKKCAALPEEPDVRQKEIEANEYRKTGQFHRAKCDHWAHIRGTPYVSDVTISAPVRSSPSMIMTVPGAGNFGDMMFIY